MPVIRACLCCARQYHTSEVGENMKSEELYLSIINNLCDGVYLVDGERRITFWNKAAEDITGYSAAEILGQRCQDNLLSHIDKEGHTLCILGCPLHDTIIDGKQRKAEVFLRHKDGHRIPVYVNISPLKDGDEIVGAVEIFTPSSPVVYEDDLIERLSNMAMVDPLTGIANRRKMESYLEYRLHELKRFHRQFCVAFLDIDNFSAFNNTYGHNAGDEMLKSVSKSINRSMRTSDLLGRWGGEEFVAVFEIKHDEEAVMLAKKLCVLTAGSVINVGGKELSVTASIGITVALIDDGIQSVIDRADSLMYQSKQKGKNCVTSDED